VESPARIGVIESQLEKTGLFLKIHPGRHGESFITAVHDKAFFEYLKRVCTSLPEGEAVYPYVFPVRNASRPPRDLPLRAGYYCIDTFTPLSYSAFRAARAGVDCTLSAADCLLEGRRLVYALVRPPGHHAERKVFGGFCYFNNAAIAAHYLTRFGRVAVLDLDYHHGNGQQDIFWDRKDVLTLSIHGHPGFAYPYFSGFAEEKGAGEGMGYNVNIPMPESVDGRRYGEVLGNALGRVRRFAPAFLVLCLGLDTSRKDPTGSWDLSPADFEDSGRAVGRLKLPVLVVQEGGYNTRTLGQCAARFFKGLWDGMFRL
jgi:acetoin utilization deacetylase AcuC-like enzyme